MLSGNLNINARQKLWNEKRIFFCTPQTLHNDVNRGTCDISDFVLLVVDEAHRATGKYAYTHITKAIMQGKDRKRGPRIVALSATPGNKLDKVAEVIENLYISKVEVRAAEDPDVKEYVHGRQVWRAVRVVCVIMGRRLILCLMLSSHKRTTPHAPLGGAHRLGPHRRSAAHQRALGDPHAAEHRLLGLQASDALHADRPYQLHAAKNRTLCVCEL
jgi:hypothetical protein